ncbi:MAG: T9SS type A sorting domain-containing protein [Bacteroidota bacterium]
MNILRLIFCVSTAIFSVCSLPAQSLDRMVWSTAGGLGMNTSGQLSHTMGQIWTHTTEESGKTFLTQGFQQPGLTGPPTAVETNLGSSLHIFPNPIRAGETLTISISPSIPVSGTVILYNLLGKRCAEWETTESANHPLPTHLQIPLDITTGVYWLHWKHPDGQYSIPLRIN